MNQIMKTITLAALLATPITQPYDRSDNAAAFGVAAIGVGLAVAAGAAIYAACTYEESLESLLGKAQRALDKSANYDGEIRTIERIGNLNNPRSTREEELYEITATLTKQQSSYYYASRTVDKVSEYLKDLRSSKENLEKRIYKLQADQKINYAQAIVHIRSNIDVIEAEARRLQKFHAFLQEHKTYMNLFEQEVIIYNKYGKLLHILDHEGANSYTAAKITQLLAGDHHSARYPYIEAYSTLRNDSEKFKNMVNVTSAYSYPQRAAWGRAILEKLDIIESMISTSPDIQHDKMRKEQDRIAEERRKLEEERRRVERERERMEYERRKAEQAARDLRDATRRAERANREAHSDGYEEAHVTVSWTQK